MKKLNTATLKTVGACALFFAASAAFAAYPPVSVYWNCRIFLPVCAAAH